MWLSAFPIGSMGSAGDAVSLIIVAAAMVISVASFSKATGSRYELKGSRAGVLLSATGVLAYLLGTSLQSDILHLLSIAVVYWGCVLSLGGLRPLISTIPAGILVVSLFVPRALSPWGLPYLEGLSWAVIVASAVLLLNSMRAAKPLGCGLCASFKREGKAFCHSCGRLVGKSTVAVPRKGVLGLVAFTIVMIVLLSLTGPLLTMTPAVSFVSYGLGGVQSSDVLPLPGWGARAHIIPVGGQQLEEYVLTSGKESLEAFVNASAGPQAAASTLVVARGNSTNARVLPSSIGQQMSGYTLTQHGVTYVDLQGVFQVGAVNGSQIVQYFVAVDLKQEVASFRADNGTAMYGAATALIGWASSSEYWSPYVTWLVSTFQQVSQGAYLVSFAAVVVILFTVARDDELAKVRRQESSFALTDSEALVLAAFPPGARGMTGEQVQGSVKKVNPVMSDSDFYAALDGVSRRGLVRGLVILRNGRPTLLWRSLV